MCRFAYKTYKVTFACFHCRKVFKKPPIEDYMKQHGLLHMYKALSYAYYDKARLAQVEAQYHRTYEEVVDLYSSQINRCPQCGAVMADLGMSFKAPKKTNVKAWRVIEGMYHIGHAFHTCGCDGFGYVPADMRAYRQYLLDRLAEYQHSVVCAARVGDKPAYIAYWKDRVEKVRAELAKIGEKA